jgi:hypothetical protein
VNGVAKGKEIYLCLGLLSGLFPSGIQRKTCYLLFIFPMRATCPTLKLLGLTSSQRDDV